MAAQVALRRQQSQEEKEAVRLLRRQIHPLNQPFQQELGILLGVDSASEILALIRRTKAQAEKDGTGQNKDGTVNTVMDNETMPSVANVSVKSEEALEEQKKPKGGGFQCFHSKI